MTKKTTTIIKETTTIGALLVTLGLAILLPASLTAEVIRLKPETSFEVQLTKIHSLVQSVEDSIENNDESIKVRKKNLEACQLFNKLIREYPYKEQTKDQRRSADELFDYHDIHTKLLNLGHIK